MRLDIKSLRAMKGQTPITCVTAYDATMARLMDGEVEVLLVGDSLGMVVQGQGSTLPVTLDEMVYHTRLVSRASAESFIMGDLPFGAYQASVEDAVRSSVRLVKEGGAQMVKLEGGAVVIPLVQAVVGWGIPVCGHLGLTPQSINKFGGYGKQAKTEAAALRLLEDAKALEAAGADMLVLENIPHELALQVSKALAIPTIGIGAGAGCDGQVQVFHDLFGLIPDFTPRHAVRYLEMGRSIQEAVRCYREDVRSGRFLSK